MKKCEANMARNGTDKALVVARDFNEQRRPASITLKMRKSPIFTSVSARKIIENDAGFVYPSRMTTSLALRAASATTALRKSDFTNNIQ